jgi:hypothetical protein
VFFVVKKRRGMKGALKEGQGGVPKIQQLHVLKGRGRRGVVVPHSTISLSYSFCRVVISVS